MTRRIGIMGGMFDPVHKGHVEVANAAIELLQLDQLRMVPCGIPNHRAGASGSSRQRIDMLRLATQDNARIMVDDCEVKRGGTAYTIDTLVAVQAETRPSSLFFILGLDAFNALSQWHRWRELFDYCHFVVISRPGYRLEPGPELGKELAARQVFTVAALDTALAGKILLVDEFEIAISSTLVRERLEQRAEMKDLLHPEVLQYLLQQKIYRATNGNPKFITQESKN